MSNNKTYLIIIVTLLLIIAYLAISKPIVQPTGITMEQMQDSLDAHDKIRETQIAALEIQYLKDSVRIAGLLQELQELPEKIERIKHYYNDKRNYINTLPVDSQISFMSGWLSTELSKEDSSR